MSADLRAAQMAAAEARVMQALAPIVSASPHPCIAVAATAVVLGRMLGMAQQAGMVTGPLAVEARHIEDLVRVGLAQQMDHAPALIGGRA